METDLLSKEVTKMLPLKKLRVSKVYEPTGLSQASNAIPIVEKSKANLAFRVNQGFYEIHFLHLVYQNA